MASDTTSGEDLKTKEKLYESIELQIPTNNKFLITAERIRKALKDIVETLWKPKPLHITSSNAAQYFKQNVNYWLEKAEGIDVNKYCEFGGGHLVIPKCDTIYLDDDIPYTTILPNSDGKILFIDMDNVSNGHTLRILGHLRPSALVDNQISIFGGNDPEQAYIDFSRNQWKYKEDGDIIRFSGNLSKSFYAKNRPWGGYNSLRLFEKTEDRGSIKSEKALYDKQLSGEPLGHNSYYFIELMYWNGVWYECAY